MDTRRFLERSGCVRKPSGAVRCWCYGQSNCNNPENSRKLYKAFVKGDETEFNRIIDEIETSEIMDTRRFLERSGCVRKPSGAVRCWCYGQSNCNNPENSRKLYKAFVKGDETEFNRIIDEIETSDVSDYNYAEPLLNINEPIDLNESDEMQSSSHTQSLSELRVQSAVQPRSQNKPNERSSESVEPSTTIRPKSFERLGHKSTHKSAERLYNISRHTTTAMKPAETAVTIPFKAPAHVASDPRIRPSVGMLYEAPKDREMLSDRKQQNPKFYTEPLDTVRALPTDQTPRGPKRVDPRAQHKSEQQKRYEAIELPSEADQQPSVKERIMKGASSQIGSSLVFSLLTLLVCLFLF
uniref:Uncharacterized protein n=1 Tax=Ascaris lumbricoides TaxID=6252 RepID=A0A0M3HYX2_ASCLU